MAGIINDPCGLRLFPLFQNIDLLSDGRHPVIYFFSFCFQMGRACSQLPGVVFQLSGIVFECINNRLQFGFHDCFTPQGTFFLEQER